MFQFITNFKQKNFLKKEALKSRKIQSIKFSEIKHIGIFFEMTDKKSIETIRNLKKEFQKQSIDTEIIAFYKEKEIPTELFPLIDFSFFTKKDINLWGFPNKILLDEFTKNYYDVFLDLTMEPYFISRCITSKTNSGFRVGMHFEENIPFYDFLVNEKETVSVNTFLNHIIKYLQIINP